MQPIATSTIHELISDFLFLASLWQVKSVELIFGAPAGTINFKVRYNIRYVLLVHQALGQRIYHPGAGDLKQLDRRH